LIVIVDIHNVENFNSSDYKHPVLRDVDLVVNSFVKLGLHELRVNYLPANDGSQIKYRTFMPKNKPIANIGKQ
jgi:hypothetical protein